MLYVCVSLRHQQQRRLQSYWVDGDSPQEVETDRDTLLPAESSKGLLMTNQFPISSTLYAERRADSIEEAIIWNDHLYRERIAACSPGLMYIQKTKNFVPLGCGVEEQNNSWTHASVPKTELGSIWTPSNNEAIAFTQLMSREFFNSGATRGASGS